MPAAATVPKDKTKKQTGLYTSHYHEKIIAGNLTELTIWRREDGDGKRQLRTQVTIR